MEDRSWYLWDGEDLVLRLRVQPKSSRDAFRGEFRDYYRVSITAAPVAGKANAHLIAFLAKSFGVGKSAVTVESGASSREKRVRIRTPAKSPLPDIRLPYPD